MTAKVMDIQQRIARNVRKCRSKKGWSQEDLAGEVEIDRTYISGIENGKRNPTADVLDRLAKALGVSVADLVS